jgi:hypothetical protein
MSLLQLSKDEFVKKSVACGIIKPAEYREANEQMDKLNQTRFAQKDQLKQRVANGTGELMYITNNGYGNMALVLDKSYKPYLENWQTCPQFQKQRIFHEYAHVMQDATVPFGSFRGVLDEMSAEMWHEKLGGEINPTQSYYKPVLATKSMLAKIKMTEIDFLRASSIFGETQREEIKARYNAEYKRDFSVFKGEIHDLFIRNGGHLGQRGIPDFMKPLADTDIPPVARKLSNTIWHTAEKFKQIYDKLL